MSEERREAPSPRRRDLARRAGVVALSPLLVASGAYVGLLAAILLGGAVAVDGLITMTSSQLHAAGAADPSLHLDGAVGRATRLGAVASVALVTVGAAAALLAHLLQTGSVWLPRRRVVGAPIAEPRRGQNAVFALAAGGVLLMAGAVALTNALPDWFDAPAGLLASFATALTWQAVVLVGLGLLDWLRRAIAHRRDLRMTSRERLDDARASGADPRWRTHRRRAPAGSVETAAVVVAGADCAVAVSWHPVWEPVPTVAAARPVHAAYLLAAAARWRVPVRRDPELATELARLGQGAAVPSALHPRLAAHMAEVAARDPSR